jgi:hypothetical protein
MEGRFYHLQKKNEYAQREWRNICQKCEVLKHFFQKEDNRRSL